MMIDAECQETTVGITEALWPCQRQIYISRGKYWRGVDS